MAEIFCGVDWAETHHDVAVFDRAGTLLGRSGSATT